MKKTLISIAILGSITLLTGCNPTPVPHDEVFEIGPNQTAFLIALDGDTKSNQKKFDSAKALEENKIAMKRVIIPHVIIDTCNGVTANCNGTRWIDAPKAKLITINRQLVSREWTATPQKGTSAKNQSITVESNESIDFDLGAVITAQVKEPDAALFLYTYGGKQLEEIIDSDIRNYMAQSLSEDFGTHALEEGRKNKIQYFRNAFKKAQEFFAEKGITILTFGSVEGMTYHDEQIQRSINKTFEAEQANLAASKQAEAAIKLSANKEAVLMQQSYEIRKQEVENQKAAIAKWDGHGPTVMTSSGSGQMFNIPVTVK